MRTSSRGSTTTRNASNALWRLGPGDRGRVKDGEEIVAGNTVLHLCQYSTGALVVAVRCEDGLAQEMLRSKTEFISRIELHVHYGDTVQCLVADRGDKIGEMVVTVRVLREHAIENKE